MPTKEDLIQRQSLPLDAKVRMTINRIKEFYDYFDGDVYLSFSGGKDSTVLKHIVDANFPDIPAVFIQTGQEYPEVRRFAMAQPNVTVLYPKKKFSEIVKEFGFPLISKEQAQYLYEYRTTSSEKLRARRINGDDKGRFKIAKRWLPILSSDIKVSHKCCNFLKKEPAKRYERETGRKPIVATMAEESKLRYNSWIRNGCNAFDGARSMSRPMSFWTEQDVLRYIALNRVEIPSVYGDVVFDGDEFKTTGLDRTGCIACGFGVQLEGHPNRFERLAKSHPKQWDYVINRLGMGRALEAIGVKEYGKE